MSDIPEKSRRDEYAETTRNALLDAARQLFVEIGYQKTGIEAIAKVARVTRGAFYHHFRDKIAIFDALVMRLQAEAIVKVEGRARAENDRWTRLRHGLDAFLEACSDPIYRRLVIQDAPSVLGASRFREIDSMSLSRLLTGPLQNLQKAGELECPNVFLLSRMVGAMMWEVAVLQSEPEAPATLRTDGRKQVLAMLETFRRQPGVKPD